MISRKKLFHKSFIFFVDKLNIRDFNFLTVLKLIFICESCAMFITKYPNECKVSTLLYFFIYLLFWLLLLRLASSLSALFWVVSSWHSFFILSEIITRLIFYVCYTRFYLCSLKLLSSSLISDISIYIKLILLIYIFIIMNRILIIILYFYFSSIHYFNM